MPIAILTLVPSPAHSEIVLAIQQAGMEVLDLSSGAFLENHTDLQALVLIADSDDLAHSPAAQSLSSFLKTQALEGKIILGLGCGAAQLLAEGGLVPGLYNDQVGLQVNRAAEGNDSGQPCWMRLSEDYQLNAFTKGLSTHELLPLRGPVKAQFVIPPALLLEMQAQGQTVFLFCDAAGQLLLQPSIAAISNKAGRVLALLALPGAGTLDRLLQSLKNFLESPFFERVDPLYYWPRK